MAAKLPPVGWLQQGSPVPSLLGLRSGPESQHTVAEDEMANPEVLDLERGLPRLASQGLVYALVLGPPLQLAVGNPAAFFGTLNVRRAVLAFLHCVMLMPPCLIFCSWVKVEDLVWARFRVSPTFRDELGWSWGSAGYRQITNVAQAVCVSYCNRDAAPAGQAVSSAPQGPLYLQANAAVSAPVAQAPPISVPPLQMAGAYGMTVLYGVAPPLMALRLRQQQTRHGRRGMAGTQPGPNEFVSKQPADMGSFFAEDAAEQAPPQDGVTDWVARQQQQLRQADMLPGGRPVLVALCVMATGVTMGQLWRDLGAPSGEHIVAGAAAVLAGVPAALLPCL